MEKKDANTTYKAKTASILRGSGIFDTGEEMSGVFERTAKDDSLNEFIVEWICRKLLWARLNVFIDARFSPISPTGSQPFAVSVP